MKEAFYKGEIIKEPLIFFYGAVYQKQESLMTATQYSEGQQRVKVRVIPTHLRRAKIFVSKTEEYGYVAQVLTYMLENYTISSCKMELIVPMERVHGKKYYYYMRDDLLNSVLFANGQPEQDLHTYWSNYDTDVLADQEKSEEYQQSYFIKLDTWDNVCKLKEISESDSPWLFKKEFK